MNILQTADYWNLPGEARETLETSDGMRRRLAREEARLQRLHQLALSFVPAVISSGKVPLPDFAVSGQDPVVEGLGVMDVAYVLAESFEERAEHTAGLFAADLYRDLAEIERDDEDDVAHGSW